MTTIRRGFLSIITFVMMVTFCLGVTTVKAEDLDDSGSQSVEEADIALVSGFYCLHPHKQTPTPYNPVHMTAVPSTEYDGYSQDILKEVAAAVIMRGVYQEETQIYIDNSDLQQVIWTIVCSETVTIGEKTTYVHLNGRPEAEKYYNYVMDNYPSLPDDDYTMTIWVSTDIEYQDILEARLVEKHGAPTVEKKVRDTNDTNNSGDAAVGWEDSADYDIGDEIPFQITATLRDMPNFKAYYLEFVDHMEHMTIVPGTMKVEIDGKDVTDSFTINSVTEDYTTDLSVKCENILPLGAKNGSKVVVSYSATLNVDAVVGVEGNPNEVHLLYTRSSGTADKGMTLPDTVKVFTYRMIVDKFDGNGKILTGAAFKLSKLYEDGTYKLVALIGAKENEDGTYTLTDEERTHFEWTGIDDGTYKLEEVVTPTGYNTIEPIEFWVKANHDSNAEIPELHYVNSNYDGFDGFIPNEYLEMNEIKIPNTEGYYGMSTGDLSAKIVNTEGVVLPSTGGLGTKMFYMIGFVMVLVAGALLIARRRVQS